MSASDHAFVGSIPEIYDRYLGPMLFEPYADEIAGRLSGLRVKYWKQRPELVD